jgi:hypothetical protein
VHRAERFLPAWAPDDVPVIDFSIGEYQTVERGRSLGQKRIAMNRKGILAVSLVVSCAGSTTLVDATTESALASAQCTFQGFNARLQSCLDAFNTCSAAEGADLAACQTVLKACLPPPPPRPQQMGADCAGGPRGAGPPGGPDGDRDGGQRPPRPPPPLPDSAALAACHDALSSCLLTQTEDQASCFVTEHDCVRAAFRAAFEASCDSLPADAPAQIVERCAQGVDGMPPLPDGGSQCQ